MKALKIIGIILLVFIGLPLIISLFLPSKVHVERSRIIEAPAPVVFEQINNLRNWEKWSPWHKIDPGMKLSYSTKVSGEGASYSWSSDHEKVGNGKLTILKSIPYDTIITEMDFMENGKGTATYYIQTTDKGVKVTWGMDSDMGANPIGKWFGLFMDKLVGPDFEKGLQNLEKVSKQEAKTVSSAPIKIEMVSFDNSPVLTVRTKTTPSEISRTLGQSYIEILAFMRMNNIKQAGPPFSFYHSHTSTEVDMEPGVPVNVLPKTLSGNIKSSEIKKGNAVVAEFFGPHEESAAAHIAIDKWVMEHNKKVTGSPWEVYVTDASVEKDTSKWLTKVYYPVE